MANRFFDSNFYKSPFVRSLKGPLKSLYSFIICEATPSGVWAVDIEIASMYTGFSITLEDFNENFIQKNKAIEVSTCKYFFPDFIEHQYPSGLQGWNKAHNKIIIELKNWGFLREEQIVREVKGQKVPGTLYFVNKGALKGLQSPQGIGNGIGIGIGNGIGNGIGQTERIVFDEKLLVPEMFLAFKKALPKYPAFVDKDFKPLLTIAKFINEQSGANGNEIDNQKSIVSEWTTMCEVISKDKFYKTKTLSTISNSIQEIYQITKNGKETSVNRGNTQGSIYGNKKRPGAHATGL